MREYQIWYKGKNGAVCSSIQPMTFKEALIVRSKLVLAVRYKHRSIEIRVA